MTKRTDIIGQTFGCLLVLRDSGQRRHKAVLWECLCNCGKIHYARTDGLTRGEIKSCGHLMQDVYQNVIPKMVKASAERARKISKQYGGTLPQCLNDTVSKSNTSGYRNIEVLQTPYGKRYKVSVRFKRRLYSGGTHDSLQAALVARDRLREEKWGPTLRQYRSGCLKN